MNYPQPDLSPATPGEESQIATILRKAGVSAGDLPDALRFFRLDGSGAALYRMARSRKLAQGKGTGGLFR